MLEKFDNPNNMDNDPSSFRNREPSEDNLDDSNAEMDEYADTFLSEDSAEDEFGNQEFSALNRQLDQLQSALDTLESRNADIHQELLELLQSNREVRRVIVEEMANEEFLNNPAAGAQSSSPESNVNNSAGKSDPGASRDLISGITSGVANTIISEEDSAKGKNSHPSLNNVDN